VLVYHDVGTPEKDSKPAQTIETEKFERQVRWLAEHGYTTVGIKDVIRWMRERIALPRRTVLLTFDDGYEGAARNALPVLFRYGFCAVVFVVTARVGSSNTWDEAKGFTTNRLMDAEQIRLWSTRGIEFGSHSSTHADLTRLADSELEREIVGSREELAAITGSVPTSFAYPFGFLDARVGDSVRKAFPLAFSTIEGVNGALTDPHLIRRTVVDPNDTLVDLCFRVRLGLSPWAKIRSLLRGRTDLQRRMFRRAGIYRR